MGKPPYAHRPIGPVGAGVPFVPFDAGGPVGAGGLVDAGSPVAEGARQRARICGRTAPKLADRHKSCIAAHFRRFSMPMFDFTCTGCGTVFEELVFGDEAPACPKCGAATQRQMSVPSPLKTGAFPFKPGPVRPMSKTNRAYAVPHSPTCTPHAPLGRIREGLGSKKRSIPMESSTPVTPTRKTCKKALSASIAQYPRNGHSQAGRQNR